MGVVALRQSQSLAIPQPVTNIGQLLAALALGWTDGGSNRRLMAGIGGQFIRTPESGYPHPYYRPGTHDIAVESGSYQMAGFIQHEASSTFKGMFQVSRADDGAWWSAELTSHGHRIAQLGVLDFDFDNESLRACPFYNPPLHEFNRGPGLSHERLALNDPDSVSELSAKDGGVSG